MSNLAEKKNGLLCPTHQCELQFDGTIDFSKGVPFADQNIHCPQGCSFSIDKGIPRFVAPDNYCSSFGLQWQRYQKTQLDSYTKTNISRKRLEYSLNMPLEALRGKVVLEAGCGAGRFTEHLIENCGSLVSADISTAVDANLKNCAGKKPYLLVQADINALPLRPRSFDVVICLGVVQHTPSPEQAIESLAKYVRPGGTLVIDHYTTDSKLRELGGNFTLGYPLRQILKRVKPEISLKITAALTAISDPIRKRTHKKLWLDRIAARLFPIACYHDTYPELDPKNLYEWTELDTFDMLTDYYKHFRSLEEIQSFLGKLGFSHISCEKGGNGVVARATY